MKDFLPCNDCTEFCKNTLHKSYNHTSYSNKTIERTLHKIIITHITFIFTKRSFFKQFKHMINTIDTQLLQTPRVSQPSPLKGISSRDYRKKRMQRFGTWICCKKVGKVSLEKIFSLPSGFFGMMLPLDLVHFNFLPSRTSFLGVKNFDWILRIG